MNEFSSQIKDQIIKLSFEGLILFGNLNCEKMLPAYAIFSRKVEWGDITFFKDSINAIYGSLIDANKQINGEQLIKKLELNSPNLEEFEDISASYAFDMCCAFEQLFQYFISRDHDCILGNAQFCIDTVDMFIQQKEGISFQNSYDLQNLEILISQDNYMKNEKNRQLSILYEIAKIEVFDNAKIEFLRSINSSFDPLINYSILL